MKKPVLIIMAAGMGSRYGGLEQIDPVDQDGRLDLRKSFLSSRKRTSRISERPSATGWHSGSRWNMYSRISPLCRRALQCRREG